MEAMQFDKLSISLRWYFLGKSRRWKMPHSLFLRECRIPSFLRQLFFFRPNFEWEFYAKNENYLQSSNKNAQGNNFRFTSCSVQMLRFMCNRWLSIAPIFHLGTYCLKIGHSGYLQICFVTAKNLNSCLMFVVFPIACIYHLNQPEPDG